MKSRPQHLDIYLMQNDDVYASFTQIDGQWIAALFAKRDFVRDSILCEYRGKHLNKEEADLSTSHYLMSARNPHDMRKRIVIDGDPKMSQNIAGYANYSKHSFANASFFDETKKGDVMPCVQLKAKETIKRGTEVRVDYDRGSPAHPFRNQMISKGLLKNESCDYSVLVWQDPCSTKKEVSKFGSDRDTSATAQQPVSYKRSDLQLPQEVLL
jgi:hypothetical protein